MENDHPGPVTHEKDHKFFYNAFSEIHKKPKIIEDVRSVIENWRQGEAIIGNGYELFLPLINEIHANKIILIHLKRDKKSWLKSWKENVNTFPESHGNFSESTSPKIHRMAAHYFKEATREEWRKWTLDEKASWYYEKTHNIIESHRNTFKDYLCLETAQLSDPNATASITKVCNKKWHNKKFTAHVNISELKYDNLNNHDKIICNRIYSQFDFIRFAKDPLLGEIYFSDKIIDGFKNRDSHEHNITSLKDLKLYLNTLSERILKIKGLIND